MVVKECEKIVNFYFSFFVPGYLLKGKNKYFSGKYDTS
jgi:hypothetical protein